MQGNIHTTLGKIALLGALGAVLIGQGDAEAKPQKTIFFAPTIPSKPTAGTPANRRDGLASWYGPGFHGNRCANGEIYDQYQLTAAHQTLPFGTRVRVTNLNNGRSVEVRINDRGPFIRGRVIDLSREAAETIGMIEQGVAPVQLDIMQ